MTAIDPTAAYLERTKARDYVRWLMALSATKGEAFDAAPVFAGRWPNSKSLPLIQRAAVDPGKMTGWGLDASPLQPLANAFVALVRPKTILGRLAGVRRVPFNVKFATQTASASVGWVGEGRPVPASALAFDPTTFRHSKIGGLVVLTDELVRSADPASEDVVEADLVAGIAEFTDRAFLDPTLAEVADLSPASISYGAPSVTASGDTAAHFRADAKALVAAMVAAGGKLSAPYWVMTPEDAIGLALLGVDDNLTINGGTLLGVPVLTSTGVPAAPGSGSPLVGDGSRIFLIDAAEVLVADGGMEATASTQGTVELDTAPTDPAAATAKMISLWQMNLVGIMALRYIRWQRRTPGSVGYITGANYGDA